MKTKNFFFAICLFVAINLAPYITPVQAQEKVAILNIYTNLPGYTSLTMGNLYRIQLAKNSSLSVIDRWDMNNLITDKKINPECNNTQGLTEIGKVIGADKMITGSVEAFSNNTIMVTVRMVDVDSAKAVKTVVTDYIYNPAEIVAMIDLSIKELLGMTLDQNLKIKLTDKNAFASAQNVRSGRLNASGPRIGMTVLTGDQAKIFGQPQQLGGFDGYPAMFQFGYQWEAQYLNEGAFQALFEFIPLVSGLDQGLFIPSFTLMNGLRNNRSGWEFAFGPTIVVSKKADGYYSEGIWHLRSEWTDSLPNPNYLVSRTDSRGNYKMTSGFVFAFGKTLKSGNLNIPVNLYFIPSKEGMRFGASFGYNSKNR
ncbi:MAG: hypothetical protein A2W93_06890 [Bacteroidetes bacterium GWF2_43_63]|nr:MAG: hypothetical protein A2W94_07645 [Bacteroidetes bacterium GWE2_42_42]OFY53345.1 MAG: hypothetical protein A2W93_06890 [Bacteroidetes bacterium GWF2_43_63]